MLFDNPFCIKIETVDVINVLNICKVHMAPGCDKMSIKLLKYFIDFIKNP
jgi:hypothetical protein